MAVRLPGFEEAVDLFVRTYGHQPVLAAIAPGRVNLIGEHTDYHGGFVFPAAIDRYVFVAASIVDAKSSLVSTLTNEPAAFEAGSGHKEGMPSWARYPAGVAWALGEETGIRLPNLEAAVHATLPVGSGLSSSAAIEMAFGTLWRLAGGLPVGDPQLALAGQRAENEFVGMNCGIMDQTASLFGVSGHAIFVDTRVPGKPIPEPLPQGLSLVVCDTNVKHEHTGSGYNDRRRESEEAARILKVRLLRDADRALVDSKREELGDVCYRRAKHIVTENARVVDFRYALEAGDRERVGELMRASHASLRDDYEVSCPEADVMSDAANAHPACIGARMMGGGFGGACIALVESDQVEPFCDCCGATYQRSTGIAGTFMTCQAVDGARAFRLR